MEYSGVTLDSYISTNYTNHSLNVSEFIHIVENLFYAVKRLNDNGIIHQDIKETNVVISNTKRLRVIDFGWAVSVDDYNSQRNGMLMKEYHMVSPPENLIIADPNIRYSYDLVYDKFLYSWGDLLEWYKYYEPKNNKQRYTDFVESLYKKTIKTQVKYVRTQLYKFWERNGLAYKSDIYSIGTTILRIIGLLIQEKDDDPVSVRLFKELMAGLLAANPFDRMDINQAIEIVKKIKARSSRDPFKINEDSQFMKDVFSQFGKKRVNGKVNFKLKSILKEIVYLNSI
jgi:serine/threonine protein kinase